MVTENSKEIKACEFMYRLVRIYVHIPRCIYVGINIQNACKSIT